MTHEPQVMCKTFPWNSSTSIDIATLDDDDDGDDHDGDDAWSDDQGLRTSDRNKNTWKVFTAITHNPQNLQTPQLKLQRILQILEPLYTTEFMMPTQLLLLVSLIDVLEHVWVFEVGDD